MTPRFHLFPFRTQKLSLVVPKILGWRRPGKIGRCRLFSLFGEKPAFSPKYGPLVKRLRRRPLTAKSGVRFSQGSPHALLAQLVEQLTLNQRAQGSSPWRCTKEKEGACRRTGPFLFALSRVYVAGLGAGWARPFAFKKTRHQRMCPGREGGL